MTRNQYVVRALLGAAMMLCLAGCAQKNNLVPATTAPLETEPAAVTTAQVTVPEESTEAVSTTAVTENTDPTQTEPEQTAQLWTEPDWTEPPVTEDEQTEPVQTEPPQTEPVQLPQIQAQPVMDLAAAKLADRMPDIEYDPSWSGGTVVRMPVSLNQTEEAMAEQLLNGMVALFTEAMEGEDPSETVTYTYSLSYLGAAEDNGSYLFAVSYTSIGEPVVEIDFDSSAVVAQATQGVLSSEEVAVTTFDGSGYEECVAIRSIPYFYSTQEAVESLIDAVETEIYTQNILGADYRKFCIAYSSEMETCHVFLLYLK